MNRQSKIVGVPKFQRKVYVSLTGLKIKRPWHIFNFVWYAIPSFAQARRAKGNLFSAVGNYDGMKHTLSVWASAEDMKSYAYSGIHLKAIKAFRKFATGKTLGYVSDVVPGSWKEVHDTLLERGKSI